MSLYFPGTAAERAAVIRAVRTGTRADAFHTGVEVCRLVFTLYLSNLRK